MTLIAPKYQFRGKEATAVAADTSRRISQGPDPRVYDANFKVYGADKFWVALNRKKIKVARCTVSG